MMRRDGWSFWFFIGFLAVAYFIIHVAFGVAAFAAPDLLTIAVLLAAREVRGGLAAGIGLGFGLLRDAASLTAFGADAVALTVLGYLGARTRDFFVGESLLFAAIYLFLGKWLHDALFYLLTEARLGDGAVHALLVRAPLAALYAAAVGTILLLVYRLVVGRR